MLDHAVVTVLPVGSVTVSRYRCVPVLSPLSVKATVGRVQKVLVRVDWWTGVVVSPSRLTRSVRFALSLSQVVGQPTRAVPGASEVRLGTSWSLPWGPTLFGASAETAKRTSPCWATPLTVGNSPP